MKGFLQLYLVIFSLLLFILPSISLGTPQKRPLKFDFFFDECRDDCILDISSLSSIDSFRILEECTIFQKIGEESQIRGFILSKLSSKEKLDRILNNEKNLNEFMNNDLGFTPLASGNTIAGETFRQLIRNFLLSKINLCSGSCYSEDDLMNVLQAQEILANFENPLFTEALARSISQNISEYFTPERTRCKTCSIPNDSQCEVDPMISCSIEIFNRFIYSWGYFNPSSEMIFIQKNNFLGNKNYLKVSTALGESQTHEEFFPKTRFRSGIVRNSFFSSVGSKQSGVTISWNIGDRSSTAPRSSKCEDPRALINIDSNENSLSDVCEIAWITSGGPNLSNLTIPRDCILIDQSRLITQKSVNEFFLENSRKGKESLTILQVMDGDGKELSLSNTNLSDCNTNKVFDKLELELGTETDLDKNGLLDSCQETGSCVIYGVCFRNMKIFECLKSSGNPVFRKNGDCNEDNDDETTSSSDEEPSIPTSSSSPEQTEPDDDGEVPEDRVLGSCYVPQNRYSCIDEISGDYCFYIKGIWSEVPCKDRDDIIKNGEPVDKSHKSEDIPVGEEVENGSKTSFASESGIDGKGLAGNAGFMVSVLLLPPLFVFFAVAIWNSNSSYFDYDDGKKPIKKE